MTTIDKTFAGMRKFHVRRFAKMFFQWVLLLTEGLYAYKCDLHCEAKYFLYGLLLTGKPINVPLLQSVYLCLLVSRIVGYSLVVLTLAVSTVEGL